MELTEQIPDFNYGGLSERRNATRFPVKEEVRYKAINSKGPTLIGTGKTLNIGSGGILFTTEGHLPVGLMVEISVNWPAKLGGGCQLKFVATGRVIRSDDSSAVMRIERYEFRTRAASANSAATPAKSESTA
jgi:hypothetical protein